MDAAGINNQTWEAYADAFQLAAEVLIERAESNSHEIDLHVYPIISV